MTKSSGRIRLFSSDLDGTLLGKPDAVFRFALTWDALPEKTRPILCYNTGRLLEDARTVVSSSRLPQPEFIIAGVGTTIFDVNAGQVLKAFSEVLEEGWDVEKVTAVVQASGFPLEKQPKRFQTPYKQSWYWAGATPEDREKLEEMLREAGLDIHIVYSSERDFDVLPSSANKGNALLWLMRHLGIPASQTLVAGDTGNDSAMFMLKGVRGILVENAQPELCETAVGRGMFQAKGVCAEGVLEGLIHYGVMDKIAISRPSDRNLTEVEPRIQHLLSEEPRHKIDSDQREFLATAYQKAIEALRKNVTPVGFSACSLEDNLSRGTDANYRSVWARDGSITIIGSLALADGDEELRHCQKMTLQGLIDHMSPNGQIPSNISIDTLEPDYSGIGGICSIDAGLWTIIACYEYIRHTGDLGFLRQNRGALQHAMNWLSAHDGNNDALLEIPEAGDWTDLFGRSYHVLYDEVLWYRTNICFGRMQEYLGDSVKAGDYLRWSRQIKKTILRNFWPSTQPQPDESKPFSFADHQKSLGDTSYLIAEITPFGFDWRCDVYGNILATLFNVLDIERAQTAFHCMWGCGVNQPLPVKNLYPVVQAGDPNWKSYYTVNLLNLPNHYHNGGIWPFVGAQWVRFIYQLGLRDLALHEMVRLAELNRKGVKHEWEFNEWAHGQTGQPMGKAFQAWSASEFILAYQTLGLNHHPLAPR